MNYRQFLTYGMVLILILGLASCSWRTVNDEDNGVSFLVKYKEWTETDYETFSRMTEKDPYDAYFSKDIISNQKFLFNKKNLDRVRYGTVKLTDAQKRMDITEIFSNKNDKFIQPKDIVWRFVSSATDNRNFVAIDKDESNPMSFAVYDGLLIFCIAKQTDHLFMFEYNLFDGEKNFQRFKLFLEGIKFLNPSTQEGVNSGAKTDRTESSSTQTNPVASDSQESKQTVNFSRVLEVKTPRMNGPDVIALQQRLLSLGFNQIGEADGYYGPMAETVVKSIQRRAGFEENGRVDTALWDFIFSNKILEMQRGD